MLVSELSHFDDKLIAITATQEMLTDDDEDMFKEFRQRKPTVSSLDNSVQIGQSRHKFYRLLAERGTVDADSQVGSVSTGCASHICPY